MQPGREESKPRFETGSSGLSANLPPWQSVFLPECYSKLSHFKVDVTLYREYKGKIPSDEFSAPRPLSTSLEITVKTLTTLDSDIFSWFTLPSVLVKVMPVACALDLFSFRFPLEK